MWKKVEVSLQKDYVKNMKSSIQCTLVMPYQRMNTSNMNGLEFLTSIAPSMYISMLQDFQLQQLYQRKFLKKAKKAVKDYRRFLTLGSSMFPVDELKVAGVDMSKPEPIRDAMEMFKTLVDEFEAMI